MFLWGRGAREKAGLLCTCTNFLWVKWRCSLSCVVCLCTMFSYERDFFPHRHHYYLIYFTFQKCTSLEVNRVIALLQKKDSTHLKKRDLMWACMTCPLSSLHWAQADSRRGSPMSFAFGGARRSNPWHQASHTLYKVKNMLLFLTTSASWVLELRLAISRRWTIP